VAALIGWSKVPNLQQFMREQFPTDPSTEEGSREIERAWRAWATRSGLTVEKLTREQVN